MDIPTLFSDPTTDIPATMHVNNAALEYGVEILALPNIPFCGVRTSWVQGNEVLIACQCGRIKQRAVHGVIGAGVGLWITK